MPQRASLLEIPALHSAKIPMAGLSSEATFGTFPKSGTPNIV